MPLKAVPEGAPGVIAVDFEDGVPQDRLLQALESVTHLLRDRPGSLPVLVSVPVAGTRQQIRLPQPSAWDDGLRQALRSAAELPLNVELRPARESG